MKQEKTKQYRQDNTNKKTGAETSQDKKYNKKGQEKTKQDKKGVSKTGQEKTKQDKKEPKPQQKGQDKSRQKGMIEPEYMSKTRHDKLGQDQNLNKKDKR